MISLSNFTTQVRFICETAHGETESKGYTSLDEMLESGRTYIFDFNYPIFDAAYKRPLELKILKHYYTREISEETVGLWKLRLNARMNEIMPFYNKLYESELLAFNPLYDVDYTRSGNRDGTEQKEESTQTTSLDTDAMTGTVSDSGSSSNTEGMSGTVSDLGSSTERTDTTGTASENTKTTGTEQRNDFNQTTRTAGKEESRDTTGNELNYAAGTKADTGTESRTLESAMSETVNGTKTTTHSGSDTDTTTKDNLNDHWDYYSDTPQGTIGHMPGGSSPDAGQQLSDQVYLTNARHVTDDTTGSSEEKTTDYGHAITDVTSETKGTESSGTDTLTRNTKESTENTATRDTKGNETGITNENESTEKNALSDTTRSDTGTKENVQSSTGRKDGTDQNIREYDTTNKKDGETSNEREYDTLNTRTGNATGITTGNAKNLEEYTEHVVGKMGTSSYAKMLMEFRETFLNIDMLVIDNLSDLFFGLWE